MDNLKGSLLMIASMAGFAIEDMFVKQLSRTLPIGQILALLGLTGGLVFLVMAARRGDRLWSKDLTHRSVVLRNLGEIIGTLGYICAVAFSPISTASAIIQAIPLVVTLGAAIFLGEFFGWRRLLAVLVGLTGVLLVIQPGADGFVPASLLAVIGVIGLSVRDLATRRVPPSITSLQLSTYAFLILVPTGAGLMAVLGDAPVLPNLVETARLVAATGFGVLAYHMLVAASRLGDVGVIAPYRYSRIVFALIVGFTIFGERPNTLTLLGAAIIVASGIYTLLREAHLRRAFPVTKPAL